MSTHGEMRLTV